MRKLAKAFIIVLISSFSLPAAVKAETVTKINDLIENAKILNGQELTIEGEAIGERMKRGDFSWVNINDGSNAIGIWLSNSKAAKINFFGNYANSGDIVKITGIFYRACKEHGGEADYHATSLEVIKSGHLVDIQISVPKIIAATVLTGLTLILFGIFKRSMAKKIN